MSTLVWERSYPWIGALTATALWHVLDIQFPVSADGLFGAAATVASVFASFLGVSKAIILTIKGGKTYRALERKGYVNDLFSYLAWAIRAAVVFAALSIVGFFIFSSADSIILFGHASMRNIFKLAWIFSGVLALLTYIRIGNVLFKLLKQPDLTA